MLQRCAAHMASATDIEESWQLGLKGVALALEGKSGEMSIVCRISDEPYQVIYDGGRCAADCQCREEDPDSVDQ